MNAIVRALAGVLTLVAASIPMSSAAAGDPPRLDDGWQVEGPIEPRLLAADGLGAVALGSDGHMISVDQDGRERWRVHLVGPESFDGIAVGADTVVVTIDDGYVAMDRGTAATAWLRDVTGAQTAAVGSAADGTTAVALVSESGVLELADGATGATRWTVTVPVEKSMIDPRAWVVGTRVVLFWVDNFRGHLRAYTTDGGVEVWRYDAGEAISLPVVTEESVTFAENLRLDEREHVLVEIQSLALDEGRELWSRRSRSASPYWTGTGTAAGSSGIALVDTAGKLTVVDADTGKVRWRRKTDLVQVQAQPHVVGDVLAMTTYGTGLMLASMRDGNPISVNAIQPGETAMTIEASAAVGDRLYLLVWWPWGDPEIWAFDAASA